MSDCSSLSTVEGKLPAGFRFHPRDDELICDYLMKKILLISPLSVHHHLNYSGVVDTAAFALLIDVDLNKVEPWELPEIACVGGKEWYFYSQRDRKYATGLRTNRATVSGYWKATGKDRAVVSKGSLVGMRKTLVFYQGRAPKGKKTDWVMHEFRLEGPFGPPKSSSSKEDWVLCRVFHKSRDSLPPKPTNTNTYDETGCSSLPALMDSYISFDTNDDNDDDNNNNNNYNNNNNNNVKYENKSLGSYQQQQVPCFSINNMSPTTTNPSHFSHLFHVAPTQPPTTKADNGGGPMGVYYTPAYGNNLQPSAGDDINVNAAMSSGGGSSSDRHMIKAVLSHLTDNMGSSSSPSPAVNGGDEAGGGSNSETYLSDVMWTSHY